MIWDLVVAEDEFVWDEYHQVDQQPGSDVTSGDHIVAIYDAFNGFESSQQRGKYIQDIDNGHEQEGETVSRWLRIRR